jgi:hypothetical protein
MYMPYGWMVEGCAVTTAPHFNAKEDAAFQPLMAIS